MSAFDISAIPESLRLNPKASSTASKNELNQDMFMKLMVTQLKSQNPLKPQDGAEFLSQLAQFSAVTGIQDLQKSFSSFSTSMNEDQALQASSLVGKSVLVNSSTGVLGASGGMGGETTLSTSASDVNVRILNGSGEIVQSINLGPNSAGQVPFQWDGLLANGDKAPAGVYAIKAEAAIDGKTQALETQIKAPVQSVKLNGSSGISIDLGALGKFAMKDIQEIL